MKPTPRKRRSVETITISSSGSEHDSFSESEQESFSESESHSDWEDSASFSESEDSTLSDDERNSAVHDEKGRRTRRSIPVRRGERGEDGEDVHDGVLDLLKRGGDVDRLKLEDCRAYLRKLKLRVSGSKEICIERIREHWRLKDGYAERLYPWSSFCINCTGDVCKGDVVMFKQRVYEKFDKVTRGAEIIGKRTIVGRVVKESYGAAKQQHTFTIEILWSKGVNALPILYPLLVKGRNLYRMKTFRQPWKNEDERFKVLNEKHQRGAAARHARAIGKAKHSKKVTKRQRSSSETISKKRQRSTPKVNTQSENHNRRDKSSNTIQQNGSKSSRKSTFSIKEHHVPSVYGGINCSSQIDSSAPTWQHHIYMNYCHHHYAPCVHGGVPHGSQISSSSSSAQQHPVHNNHHHHNHWIPRFHSSGVNRNS